MSVAMRGPRHLRGVEVEELASELRKALRHVAISGRYVEADEIARLFAHAQPGVHPGHGDLDHVQPHHPDIGDEGGGPRGVGIASTKISRAVKVSPGRGPAPVRSG